MHDLQLAYRFYSQVSDEGFSKPEFQKIVRNLTKLQLTNDQVSVMFELFDRDRDGHLDSMEFARALKKRCERGLNTPRDTGIGALFERVYNAIVGED
jgi:Ca2+-binding EF-hand superfamily protein